MSLAEDMMLKGKNSRRKIPRTSKPKKKMARRVNTKIKMIKRRKQKIQLLKRANQKRRRRPIPRKRLKRKKKKMKSRMMVRKTPPKLTLSKTRRTRRCGNRSGLSRSYSILRTKGDSLKSCVRFSTPLTKPRWSWTPCTSSSSFARPSTRRRTLSANPWFNLLTRSPMRDPGQLRWRRSTSTRLQTTWSRTSNTWELMQREKGSKSTKKSPKGQPTLTTRSWNDFQRTAPTCLTFRTITTVSPRILRSRWSLQFKRPKSRIFSTTWPVSTFYLL